ncbi:hypothetical protein DQ04_04891020 [Trypanosoma grayi]|uniref:hypothetical protein n=1 Tax=Trypanosoma grayi TaxID=71804 RepID=UPI0004F4A17D|nr:hypothetical protein DQ04_04891020 [Trypanosoma grayi]KEG09641.1 hypothetical protein DQ04_04891020 [Trypanosoma grayi]
MLSGIVLILGIMACLGVVRAFICYRANVVMQNGMRRADIDAQLAVRRHGFGVNESFPSQGRSNGVFRQCFGSLMMTFRPKSKRKEQHREDQLASSLRSVFHCTLCHSTLRTRALTSAANSMKGVEAPENSHVGGPNSSLYVADDDHDDFVVILLPCSHLFCRPCVGLEAPQGPAAEVGRENTAAHPAEEAAAEVVATAPPAPHDGEASRANNINPCLSSEGGVAAFHDGEQPALDARPESREGQPWQSEEPPIHAEGAQSETRIGGANTTRGEPRRRIAKWKEGLLRSLRRLKSRRTRTTSVRAQAEEEIVVNSIKHKCPKCKQAVKDVLFPENILQL